MATSCLERMEFAVPAPLAVPSTGVAVAVVAEAAAAETAPVAATAAVFENRASAHLSWPRTVWDGIESTLHDEVMTLDASDV